MIKEYRIIWEIDVIAKNKKDAINYAIEMFPKTIGDETTATIFKVSEYIQGEFGFFEEIDIAN